MKTEENSETGENMTSTSVLHGCFDKLSGQDYQLTCADATPNIDDGCKQFDFAHLPANHETNVTQAEVCLCTGDLCNSKANPDQETTPSTGDKTKCYECGYVEIEGAQPGPIGNMSFCGDFANPSEFAAECPNSNDCCSVVHVVTIDENTETHKNITSVLTVHGCFENVANKYDITCDDANDNIAADCKRFDYAHLPVDHETNVVEAEVCLCYGDLCNEKTPYNPEESTPSGNPETTPSGEGNQCYNCGYMLVNGEVRKNLTDVAYCGGDYVGQDSPSSKCTGEDNCCAVNRVYTNRTEEGESFTDLIVRHGCFNELGLHEQYEQLTCQGSTSNINEKCSTFDHETLPNGHEETIFMQEVCTCTGDFCNDETPTTPSPNNPTTPNPETTNGGPHNSCYACGYKQVDGGDPTPLPDQPESSFCNSFVDPTSLTAICTGVDDCCAINKVSAFRTDNDGVNHTDVIVAHGCYNDMALQYEELGCEGHSNDITAGCKVFEHETLPTDHDQAVFRMEVCICTGDLCNNEVPSTTQPPEGETTTPGGSATAAVSSGVLAVLLLSRFI